MKPFRGKRRGPQSPSVEFSPLAVRPCEPENASFGSEARRSPFGDGRTFGGRSATTGLSAVRISRGRWPVPRGTGVIDPVSGMARRRTEEDPSREGRGRFWAPFSCSCVRLRGTVLSALRLRACIYRGGLPGVGSGSVANRSVTCPTRLETRTKESNMCASHRAVRNPEAQ